MNITEVFAVIFLLLSVALAIKNNILTWPTGIICNVIYMYIFYNLNILGNTFLQAVFILQSIDGWYRWKNNNTKKVSKLDKIDFTQIIIVTLVLGYLIYAFLIFTDNKSPILDSTTTALSMTGVILLSLKKVETWYFWILTDIIYIWFFLTEGLYLSSLTYIIILILAIIGLIQWEKDLKMD
jgi:nicotinamide mononucleotide transporter